VDAITTDAIEEGVTNLYFTGARAKSAAVVDSTAGSETDQAPSVSAIKSYIGTQISASGAEKSYRSYQNSNASAITVRQIVYVKNDGTVDLARANAEATCTSKLGMVYDASIATTASGNIVINIGTRISGFTGLSAGQKVYLSVGTAGGYTTTMPTAVGEFIVEIGQALSATELEYNPKSAIQIAS
jgi:hypothetical protein